MHLHQVINTLLASLGAMVIVGCAHQIPCGPEAMMSVGASPPNACMVDGCSMAPDFNFASCCDRHDVRYWRGGSVGERAQADKTFGECIAAKDHPVLARLYHLGVRVGGTPYLPTPWRWGFGWRFPHGYDADGVGAASPARVRGIPPDQPERSLNEP